MEMKKCNRCKKEKELDCFYKSNFIKHRDGYIPRCKECNREVTLQRKQWYKEYNASKRIIPGYLEHKNKVQKIWEENNKDKIKEYHKEYNKNKKLRNDIH